MRFTAFLWMCMAFATSASAQQYPGKPIKLIVPYAAGGAADTIARTVGQAMAQELGQTIVVENRAGADGNIGAKAVASSAPDGYTLLVGDVGNMTMGPAVRKTVPYDSLKDFVAITQLVAAPNIFVVHPTVPAADFGAFIAHAKANPGKVNYASSGTGGSAHLAGELLKKATGINMAHVPYKGAGPAITDVVRGDVQAMFGLSVVLPHVKEGRLRPLAVTSLRRSPALPQVPTIAELGFPGFEATAWYGLLAPAGTPAAVVQRVHQAATNALKSPAVRERLENGGYEIVGSSPTEFSGYIASELKKWTDVVSAAGIKVDE